MKNGRRGAKRLSEFTTEMVCPVCQNTFVVYKHEKGRKTCSKKCFYETKKRRGKRICEYCGKEFERPGNYLRAMPGKYCSILCSNRSKDRKWFKTMPRTKEHRAKISAALTGENNGSWKGGVTPEHRAARNSAEYREWRTAVFQTDHFRCLMCGGNKDIEAHHLDPFSQNKAARYDPDNGITLCHECHRHVHSFGPTPAEQYMAYGVV